MEHPTLARRFVAGCVSAMACAGMAAQGWAATEDALRPVDAEARGNATAFKAALLDEAPPVADVNLPEEPSEIARRLMERISDEHPELVETAQAWGQQLQTATDLPAFLAREATLPDAVQAQWLRLLSRIEPGAPTERVLFVGRDTWLARAFDIESLQGRMIRLRMGDGSELRYALVAADVGRSERGEREVEGLGTSAQGFLRGLLVVLHESYHLHTYPSHGFPTLVAAQLHEGVVEYLARNALLRCLASDDPEMSRLRNYMVAWLNTPLSSTEHMQGLELGLPAPAAGASLAERTTYRLALNTHYPHLVALVDHLVKQLGEGAVLQRNRDGTLEALFTQVPQLADAQRVNRHLDGRSQLMERATLWSAVFAMLDVEPAEAKAHWDALVTVLDWLTRGSLVIDLDRLIVAEIADALREKQLARKWQAMRPEHVPGLIHVSMEQHLRRDRVLTVWIQQLAAAPQSTAAVQQRMHEELRTIVRNILRAPTDEPPPKDDRGRGSSGSSQGGPAARVLRFEGRPAALPRPPSGTAQRAITGAP